MSDDSKRAFIGELEAEIRKAQERVGPYLATVLSEAASESRDEAWHCWCRNDPWGGPCMLNHGDACDRCGRPREEGAPYKRWPDHYTCKPGWEYTAPMMRAREAHQAEEWLSESYRPRTAEEHARAEAFRPVLNAALREAFPVGAFERALPAFLDWRKGDR